MGTGKVQKKPKEETKVISFRVSRELHEKLEKFAQSERDEAGLTLNPSTAARRLMLRALEELDKHRK